MQISYTEGSYTVIGGGDTVKDAVEDISKLQELIGHLKCTINGKTSSKVHLRVRDVEKDKKKYRYYEAVCMDEDKDLRWAKLQLGVHQEGGSLFAKRKDKDGNWLANNGWEKFVPENKKEDK